MQTQLAAHVAAGEEAAEVVEDVVDFEDYMVRCVCVCMCVSVCVSGGGGEQAARIHQLVQYTAPTPPEPNRNQSINQSINRPTCTRASQ